MSIPQELQYTKDHEWIGIEGTVATIGITDYAVQQLGDITLVELPEVDTKVTAGEVIGTIESVKAVSDVYSPISGVVIEVNQVLEDAPETVNEDAYGDGWFLKIQLADTAESDKLLGADAYAAYVDSLDE